MPVAFILPEWHLNLDTLIIMIMQVTSYAKQS